MGYSGYSGYPRLQNPRIWPAGKSPCEVARELRDQAPYRDPLLSDLLASHVKVNEKLLVVLGVIMIIIIDVRLDDHRASAAGPARAQHATRSPSRRPRNFGRGNTSTSVSPC
jgi:hypothetical protein